MIFPDAACLDNMEPFGAGKTFGDPDVAKAICGTCPVLWGKCLDRFVLLHGTSDGITGGMTVGGLSGGELQREIRDRLSRRRAA